MRNNDLIHIDNQDREKHSQTAVFFSVLMFIL